MSLSTTILPEDFDSMVQQMLTCNQTHSQSVYEHGFSVNRSFKKLFLYLNGDKTILENWKKPKWLLNFEGLLLENLHPMEIVEQYQLFHDCGKPFCKSVDESGKVHFPDHANVSRRVWEHVGGDPLAGKLIGFDMAVHTASSQELENLLHFEWTKQDSVTLLLTSLCEIHANAQMFGGAESISFMSKFKKLERRGMQICKHWFVTNQIG